MKKIIYVILIIIGIRYLTTRGFIYINFGRIGQALNPYTEQVKHEAASQAKKGIDRLVESN